MQEGRWLGEFYMHCEIYCAHENHPLRFHLFRSPRGILSILPGPPGHPPRPSPAYRSYWSYRAYRAWPGMCWLAFYRPALHRTT